MEAVATEQFESEELNAKENWKKIIRPYIKPDNKKSWWQVVNTIVPYLLCWAASFYLYQISYWVALPVILFTSLLSMRIFIIMHDCGHGSFFRSKKLRTYVGYISGFVNWVPYHQWTLAHAIHHKNSGNLDKRGTGDVWTATVEEYQNMSKLGKLGYRLYRNPIVTFIIGPFYLFMLSFRWFAKQDEKKEKQSVIITNLYIVAYCYAMGSWLGWQSFFVVQFSILMFAQIFGVWMFYVQHQYEGVYWKRQEDWDYFDSAMDGSSYFKLPALLQWLSGNIGFHHIHHLSHSIPNYYLEKCMKENKAFQSPLTLTLKSSFHCAFLNIYDESTKDLITFREMRRRYSNKAPVYS